MLWPIWEAYCGCIPINTIDILHNTLFKQHEDPNPYYYCEEMSDTNQIGTTIGSSLNFELFVTGELVLC